MEHAIPTEFADLVATVAGVEVDFVEVELFGADAAVEVFEVGVGY